MEQSLVFQPIEGVGDAIRPEHLLRRQHRPVADRFAELIVQLEQRDAFEVEALEARHQAALDRARDVVHLVALDPHLGGDVGLRLERVDVAADRGLGLAVAVERGGVDPVDADGERAVERAHRAGLFALDQDTAGDPGAERDLGDQKSGTAEQIFPHHSLLSPLTPTPGRALSARQPRFGYGRLNQLMPIKINGLRSLKSMISDLGPQLEALDFSGRGLRQIGAELDPARIFVGRELLLAMLL